MEKKLRVAINNTDKVPDDLKEILSLYPPDIILRAHRWLERKTEQERKRQEQEAFNQHIWEKLETQGERFRERQRQIAAGLIVPKTKKKKPKS